MNIDDRIEREQEIRMGVGAGTVITVLGPIIQERVDRLITELMDAPPELNSLLNIRAQIKESYRILKELERAKANGEEAADFLDAFSKSGAAVRDADDQ